MRSRSFRGVHRPPFTRRHLVEPLESRTLLTTAALTGTSGNDVFEIAADWSAGTYQFWCGNTLQAEVPKSQGIAFTVVGNGGHDELDVDPQVSVTLTNDPGADGTKLDLRLFGYADFHDAAQLAQFQSIYPAGKGTSFTIDPDGTRLVEADSLTIDQFANGALMGRINLNDNAMIIHNPDATTAAAVQANIQAFVANSVNGGYANGAWNGWGISSGTAGMHQGLATAIGNRINANGDGNAANALWHGRPVNSTDNLLEYTYYGDANLNGSIDVGDLGALATNYGVTAGATWAEGDFNYDGHVDFGDLGLYATASNSDPHIALPPIQEGQSYSLTLPTAAVLQAFNFAQLQSIGSFNVRWGDGSGDAAVTTSNISHTYTGGQYGYAIALQANGVNTSNAAVVYDLPHIDVNVLPAAPTGLTAIAVAPTKIDLAWTDNSSIETSYVIEYSADNGATFTALPDQPANTHNFRVASLSAGTTYLFRLHAVAPGGRSADSNTVSQTTLLVSPLEGIIVTANDISAVANQSFNGVVGTFVTPGPLPANAQATVDWGDGAVSQGTISPTGGNNYQITASHLYLVPDVAPLLVQIDDGANDPAVGLGSATVTDPGPTIVTATDATVSSDGTSVTLSVQADDPAGEGQLTYHWAATGPSTDITFDTNDDNDAKNTVATLSKAGAFTFTVTITNDGGQTTTSSKVVTVAQHISDVNVSPDNASVACGTTQQFTATALDQFGDTMLTQPTSFSWTAKAGTGQINTTSGLYFAGATTGVNVVTASSGTASGSTSVTIKSPTVFSATADTGGPRILLTIPAVPTGATVELEERAPGVANFRWVSGAPISSIVYAYYVGTYDFRLRILKDNSVSYLSSSVSIPQNAWNSELPPWWVIRRSTIQVSYNILRGDGFTAKLNGQAVSAIPGQFWGGRGHFTLTDGDTYDNPSDSFLMELSWYPPYYVAVQETVTGFAPTFLLDSPSGGSMQSTNGDGGGSISFGPEAPIAPTGFVATAASNPSGDGVRLSWDNSSDDEDSFRVERSQDGGTTFSPIATLAMDTTCYTDATIAKGLSYIYRVIAANFGGDSPPSNSASAGFPAAPTSLTASYNQTAESVTLNWTDTHNDATAFEVQWSQDGSNFFTIDEVPAGAGGTYSYTDTDLAAAKTNHYRIVARRDAVASDSDDPESDPSNVATPTTIAPPVAFDDVNGDDTGAGTLSPYSTKVGELLHVDSSLGLLINDFDPQGLPLEIVNPQSKRSLHGTVTLFSSGSFDYQPDAEFAGIDTFTYSATNGALQSNVANVEITVANAPVVTVNDKFDVAASTPLPEPSSALAANDDNPDDSGLTYYSVPGAGPDHGALSLNPNGGFTYTPANGFSGIDHFEYFVNDGFENSNVANVVLAVGGATYIPPAIDPNPPTPSAATIQTFPNNLKGLWDSYIASKDRWMQVGQAMNSFANAIDALETADPDTTVGFQAVDAVANQYALLYKAYDAYVGQSAATASAAGAYMKSIKFFTSPWDAAAINAVNALPRNPVGLTPNRAQLNRFQAALNNFSTGADWMVATNTCTITMAEDTHEFAERTVQAGTLVVAGGALYSGAKLASEKGAAEFGQYVVKNIVAAAAATEVASIVSLEAKAIAQKWGWSEHAIRITADSVQLGALLWALRVERQARAAAGEPREVPPPGDEAGIEARLAAGAKEDVNGLTKAGRALEKHGSRPGSKFPAATGNVAAKNAQGQQVLEQLLRSNSQSIRPNRFGGWDIFDNNTGRGGRFDGTGIMMGFLE